MLDNVDGKVTLSHRVKSSIHAFGMQCLTVIMMNVSKLYPGIKKLIICITNPYCDYNKTR